MSIRTQRVEELIKNHLSKLITRDFGGEFGLISITSVIATADFKLATVHVSVLPEENQQIVLRKIAEKVNEYQHILGKDLKMRNTPKLTFKIDHLRESENQVEKLLKEIENEP